MTDTIQNKIIKNLQEVVELQEGIIKDQKKLMIEVFSLNKKILREWNWSNLLWLVVCEMVIAGSLIVYVLT